MKNDILKKIEDENIEFIYLIFTDITGEAKKVTIPAREVENALESGIWFDGSSIEGFARIFESDMHLKPDIETFAVLPWSKDDCKIAQIICDVYLPDGTPFSGDPRGVLKKILGKAKKMGYQYNVGPEIEFFLLERDKLPDLKVHDSKGYFDLGVQSRAVEICQETMRLMQNFGYSCESYHHEVSQGQHETDLSYDNALKIADGIICLKHTLRTISMQNGMKVTFMPKPIYGINGSGMHTHQSLADNNGNNIFYESKDKYNLSKQAYNFLAGQIQHAKALTALLAPTVNSYKRLIPGFEAPVYICWGQINRSALIRIPMLTKNKIPHGKRLEIRCPDPSCNPYLAFAAMLAAGIDGIENELTPPNPIEENVYGFSDEKLEELNIDTLPGSIHEAVEELEQDTVLTDLMGEKLLNHFVNAKKQEWQEFLFQVTPWEVERYL